MSTQETGGGPPGTGTVSGGGPEAACNVDSAGSAAAGFLSGCTVAKTGVGIYEITLTTPRAASACVVHATPTDTTSNGLFVAVIHTTATTKTVHFWDAINNETDTPFTFSLFVV